MKIFAAALCVSSMSVSTLVMSQDNTEIVRERIMDEFCSDLSIKMTNVQDPSKVEVITMPLCMSFEKRVELSTTNCPVNTFPYNCAFEMQGPSVIKGTLGDEVFPITIDRRTVGGNNAYVSTTAMRIGSHWDYHLGKIIGRALSERFEVVTLPNFASYLNFKVAVSFNNARSKPSVITKSSEALNLAAVGTAFDAQNNEYILEIGTVFKKVVLKNGTVIETSK
jgi:hypothetical protein